MDGALATARGLHVAALALVFGASVFDAVLAPAPLGAALLARQRRALFGLAAFALASGAAEFALTAQTLTDAPPSLEGWADVAGSTAFGRAFVVHMALVAGLIGACRGCAAALACMSALALASLALTGHPGAAGPPLAANHALHLVTMAGWIGGLPPFTAALALYAADPARRDALGAMMRYSRAGHVAAPLVLLTGALDAVAITGAPPWRALTFYRGAMLVKVALFAAMAALALVNRYVLAPRVRGSRGAARALAAGAAAEVALGLAALAAGALLSETDPS